MDKIFGLLGSYLLSGNVWKRGIVRGKQVFIMGWGIGVYQNKGEGKSIIGDNRNHLTWG